MEIEITLFLNSPRKKKSGWPWKKALIIRLLGRKIGFRALKPRLNKMWVKDGILDIINLPHDHYMVKFSDFIDFEYALTGCNDPIINR